MRLYSDYPHASITMSKDDIFKKHLQNIFSNNQIEYLFETGTYLGLGSTTTIAESYPENYKPISYVTIEANPLYAIMAKRNLKKYPFVEVIYGNTISEEEGIAFISNYDILKNHYEYEEIFIDDINNPIQFYTNEIKGNLSGNIISKYVSNFLMLFKQKNEKVLENYLVPLRDKKPMIILDSAGGVGFLEFQKVINIMGENPYWLILDDVHHLKHFKSLEYIKKNEKFQVMDVSMQNGWAIIKHLI